MLKAFSTLLFAFAAVAFPFVALAEKTSVFFVHGANVTARRLAPVTVNFY